MINLVSTAVKVFPAAKDRSSVGVDDISMSRLLTEFNVSNIIRQLLRTNTGFVIGIENIKEDSAIVGIHAKFNLSGYYFDINYTPSSELTNNTVYDVYAKLCYDSNPNVKELAQDEQTEGVHYYYGLGIEEKGPGESAPDDSLHLFSFMYVGDTVGGITSVNIPEDSIQVGSTHIFNIESVEVGGIDGKPRQS